MSCTEYFQYQAKHTQRVRFPWGASLFDQQITDMTGENQEYRLLIRLPEDAKLLVNGHEYAPSQPYMIDRCGTVYAYMERLDAAVESEIFFACDSDGQEIQFNTFVAEQIRVISYEDAINLLSNAQVVW